MTRKTKAQLEDEIRELKVRVILADEKIAQLESQADDLERLNANIVARGVQAESKLTRIDRVLASWKNSTDKVGLIGSIINGGDGRGKAHDLTRDMLQDPEAVDRAPAKPFKLRPTTGGFDD